MLKILLCLLAFNGYTVFSSDNNSVDRSSDSVDLGVLQGEVVELYGSSYLVDNLKIIGSLVKWSDIKSHIPRLLPDVQTKNMHKSELLVLLRNKVRMSGVAYSKYMKRLSSEMTEFIPSKDQQMLNRILTDYILVNRSDAFIEKYGKSGAIQVEQAQLIHNEYVLLSYLYKIVSNSK